MEAAEEERICPWEATQAFLDRQKRQFRSQGEGSRGETGDGICVGTSMVRALGPETRLGSSSRGLRLKPHGGSQPSLTPVSGVPTSSLQTLHVDRILIHIKVNKS